MKPIFSYLLSVPSYLRYLIETRCKWLWEVFFLFLTSSVFLVSILIQVDVISLPPSLLISVHDQTAFFLTIFQIQATVSTLSIMVISIIAGITREQYYGIPITNYVLNLRPRFLKHKYLVISDLLLIIANLIFCSLHIYDLCSACLVVSILFSIRMFVEIYSVLSQTQDVKKYEVREYILNEIEKERWKYKKQRRTEEVLSNIRDELENAVICSDFPRATDDVDLLNNLLRKYQDYLDNDALIRLHELHSFVRSYQYAVSCLLDSNDSKYSELYINCLIKAYQAYNDQKICTDLWQDVHVRIMTRLSTIDVAIVYSNKSLFDLRYEMYNNIKESEDTWEYATDFLPRLYDALRANVQYQNSAFIAKQRFWQAFTVYQTDYSQMTKTRFLSKPRAIEYNKFYKQLVDNHDYEVFSAVFPINFAEYVYANLAAIARAYDSIYTQGFQKEVFIKYKQIFIANGHEFYMHYKARDLASLLENCIELINNLREEKIFKSGRPYYLHFLSEYQSEFLFYYILLHLNELNEQEINDTVIKFFQGNENNLYRCFYFSGDSNLFNLRFNMFLDLTLGYWDLSDRGVIKKAYDFCTEFFNNRVEDDSDV